MYAHAAPIVHNDDVTGNMLNSSVPEPKRVKPRRSLTLDQGLYERVERVSKRCGLSVSRLVEQALRQRIAAWERDPGEILRLPEES